MFSWFIFVIIAKILKGKVIPIESYSKAIEAANAALNKKAIDTLILDLKGLTVIADYFVVCSGESTTQVKAIADNVEQELKSAGVRPTTIEGGNYANWILLDYGDVIVHVFEKETRAYYELEKFWLDAPRIKPVEDVGTMKIPPRPPLLKGG
jgi:ribosome-associated protein